MAQLANDQPGQPMSKQREELVKLTKALITAFNNAPITKGSVNPKVVGSMAYLLLGVDYPESVLPQDIDIAVSDLSLAQHVMKVFKKITAATKQSAYVVTHLDEESSRVCHTYEVTLGEFKTKVQLMFDDDMGFSTTVPHLTTDGIPTLNPVAAAEALITRNPMRNKDRFALYSLMQRYPEELVNNKSYSTKNLNTTVMELYKAHSPESVVEELRLHFESLTVKSKQAIRERDGADGAAQPTL